MTLIKKTTASVALVALTSGLLVNTSAAYTASEVASADKLASKGIIVKKDAAGYNLDQKVLRQEIAAVARGVAGIDKATECSNLFKDVSATTPNTWACYTVEALANAGLIAKNANFRPEANITKAEAVGMIVKARYGSEYSPVAGNGDWQKQVVDFAVAKGIATQFTNYNTAATRGFVFEVAAKTFNDEVDPICELLGGCTTEPKKEEPKKEEVTTPVTGGELKVSLSAQNPANGVVAANTPRSDLLAFDVTAGSKDVTLRKATFKFTGSGDSKIIEDLSVYIDNVLATKNEGTFNSRLESTLSFDRDIVIKAGETKTLFVKGFIKPSNAATTYNQMVRVELVNLETSATVTGDKLSGALLTPYEFANKAELTVETQNNDSKLYIGQEASLYVFSIREKSRREDAYLKAFEVEVGGSADIDSLVNLSLTANGKKVDATFTYKRDKIAVSLNEKIPAGQSVNFVLKGEASDDIDKNITLKLNDLYVIGANSNVAVKDSTAELKTVTKNIVGTNLNFTFNRNDINEISKNSTNVKVGELVFVSTSEYAADIELTIANSNSTDVVKDVKRVELDGERVTANNNVYTFKNINLAKGTTKLDINLDTEESIATGSFTIKAKVVKLREESTGAKIEDSTKINAILNNNDLSKTIRVIESGLTITDKKVNDTKVMAKNNPEVVLYKGSIDVKGSENITINDMNFTAQFDADALTSAVETSYNGVDLNAEKVITGVKLNIGGKETYGYVAGNEVKFNSVFATVEKGAKNVEFLVTATLRDRDITNTQQVKLTNLVATLSAEKSKPTDVKKPDLASTVVNMTGSNVFRYTAVNTSSNRILVSGTKNAEIASFKLSDSSSEAYMDKFTLTLDAENAQNTNLESISNVRLVEGSNVLASGGKVVKVKEEKEANTDKIVKTTYAVEFENFTIPMFSNSKEFKLVVDLPAVTTAGGDIVTFVGDVKLTKIAVESTEASISNAANITDSKTITVAASNLVVSNTDNRFGNKDEIASFKLSVSKDNASEFASFNLAKIEFDEENADKVKSIKIGNKTLTKDNGFTVEGTKAIVITNEDISNLTDVNIEISFEPVAYSNTTAVTYSLTVKAVTISATDNNGKVYTINNASDNTVLLGSYTNN